MERRRPWGVTSQIRTSGVCKCFWAQPTEKAWFTQRANTCSHNWSKHFTIFTLTVWTTFSCFLYTIAWSSGHTSWVVFMTCGWAAAHNLRTAWLNQSPLKLSCAHNYLQIYMKVKTDSKGLQPLKWCDVFMKWAKCSKDSSLIHGNVCAGPCGQAGQDD